MLMKTVVILKFTDRVAPECVAYPVLNFWRNWMENTT